MNENPRYYVLSAERFDGTTPLATDWLPNNNQNTPRHVVAQELVGRLSFADLARPGTSGCVVLVRRWSSEAEGDQVEVRTVSATETKDDPPTTVLDSLLEVSTLLSTWSRPLYLGPTDALALKHLPPGGGTIELLVGDEYGEILRAHIATAEAEAHTAFGVPVTVQGAVNSEGIADSLARSDHQHALAVSVSDALDTFTRPGIRFEGPAVSVVDAPPNVVVNIGVDTAGLATNGASVSTPITGALAPYIQTQFTVPTGTWDIEVEASGTVRLTYPGDPAPVGISVDYDLYIVETATTLPFSGGRVSLKSTSNMEQDMTVHSMGRITLAAGVYTAYLRAQSSLIADASASFLVGRRIAVRLFAPGA